MTANGHKLIDELLGWPDNPHQLETLRLAVVPSGGDVLSLGAFMRSSFVATRGTASVVRGTRSDLLEAPFEIGFWAADSARASKLQVVAETDLELLLCDWRDYEQLLRNSARITRLSRRTEATLFGLL